MQIEPTEQGLTSFELEEGVVLSGVNRHPRLSSAHCMECRRDVVLVVVAVGNNISSRSPVAFLSLRSRACGRIGSRPPRATK